MLFQSSQISTINLLLISKSSLCPLFNPQQFDLEASTSNAWSIPYLASIGIGSFFLASLMMMPKLSSGELCLGLQGIFTMTMMEGITVMLVMLPDTLAAATFWMNFQNRWERLESGHFICCWRRLCLPMYSARNLEMAICFSLKSRPSERFHRPEMSEIKAEISLCTNVKLIFH